MVCPDCKSVDDCVLVIALTLLRRVLPQSGKTFLELKKINDWGALREALKDWLSDRQKGNFYKPSVEGGWQNDNSGNGSGNSFTSESGSRDRFNSGSVV